VSLAARARAASTERRAVFAVIGAVVLWSASSWFVRAGESDALVFTTYRLWFALPPLAVGAYLRARNHPERRLVPPGVARGHWALVMFGAGAFFVGGAATAFAALGMTRLLDVTLIGALSPIIVIAFAVAFLGEHVHRGLIVRAAIAILGTIIVAGAASSGGSWSAAGDAMAILSLVLNSGWFLYGRIVRTRYEIDPIAFMFGSLVCATIIITPVTLLVHGNLSISHRGLFFAFCTMLSGTTAHVLMTWAHRYVPTSISSPLLLAEPPIVAAGAWIFFGESVTALEAVGSAIVVASLWGLVRSPELAEVEDDTPDPVPPV
jgi:drug/metabolite transporter (DMT)-like permease